MPWADMGMGLVDIFALTLASAADRLSARLCFDQVRASVAEAAVSAVNSRSRLDSVLPDKDITIPKLFSSPFMCFSMRRGLSNPHLPL